MKEKIKVKSIIEIVGSPKEFAERAMEIVLEKLGERKDIVLSNKEVFAPEKIKDKPFWSTFCDLEFTVDDMDGLLSYCFDFLPSSVEIIEPTTMHLANQEISRVFNDTLARLHEYHIGIKNLQAKNAVLQRGQEEPQKEEKQA